MQDANYSFHSNVKILSQQNDPPVQVIPCLHDEASSTSWLDELASSCKRGISYNGSV